MLAFSFVVYTSLIVAVGIYSTRYSKPTDSDFFLANRGLGAWVAALSSSASAESGWVTLGLVGDAFTVGISAMWMVPGVVLAFVFNWTFLAPRLRTASLARGSLTIPDILADRFEGAAAWWIRFVAVLIILSMLTTYVAAQLNAAGKAFSGSFDVTYERGVLFGVAIVLLYTVTGGFRAIAWTDVIQSVFMIAAATVLPVVVIFKLGGFEAFVERLHELEPSGSLTNPLATRSGQSLLGFLAVQWGVPLGYFGQPHVLVRLMAVKDAKSIRRAAIISTVWVTVLFIGIIFLGITLRAWFGTLEDPERALPLAASDPAIVPAVIGGMLLAAILAAICSTVDSQLLVAASAISHDVWVRMFRSHPSLRWKLWIDRSAVLIVAIVGSMIALGEVRQVFDFVIRYAWAGMGAGFGPPLILLMLWKRTSPAGILAGMITGVTTVIVWQQVPLLRETIYNLVPAFAISLLAVAAFSLLFPTNTDRTTETPCESAQGGAVRDTIEKPRNPGANGERS